MSWPIVVDREILIIGCNRSGPSVVLQCSPRPHVVFLDACGLLYLEVLGSRKYINVHQ